MNFLRQPLMDTLTDRDKKFMKLYFLPILIFFSTSLHATSIIAPTFPELVAESQVIARVKVTEIRAAWSDTPQGRIIKTYVTFEVIKQLKARRN